MNDPLTRRQLFRRAAAGGALLSLPALLAACGGGIEGGEPAPPTPPAEAGGTETGGAETTAPTELADKIKISNWPLYIDEADGTHPTLDQFTQETGVEVDYIEDINSNEELFGKIQGPLSQGQSIDRDIIIPTAWLAARLKNLGYLLPLDKSAIPNIVNLEDTLAHPDWDPNRDYSLPWQTYMTGIGYDPEKVGFEITSVEQLLDPSLKGKVTMLNSQEDTVNLFLLEMGSDPTKVDPAAFDEVIAKLQKAVDAGQIRQFTGNDYTGPLSKGDVWASIAWSGDIVQLQASNPKLKFVIPDAGGATSVDTMVIPLGGNVYTASTYMNFFYQPEVMAQVEAWVNYIPPVKGVKEAITEIDPALAENPLIFPPPEVRAKLYEYEPAALDVPEYQEKWQAVIGA
jgi:spermidine/putrescine transport system substrate-binding protein